MPTILTSFRMALLFAPLLASCDGWGNSPPFVVGPDGLELPYDCLEGQLIQVDSNQKLICVPAPSWFLTPPICNPDTQALISTKDARSGNNVLNCAIKGTGASDVTTTTRIMNATTNVTNLQTQVDLLTASSNHSRFVGASSVASRGLLGVSGNVIEGPHAGALICSMDYPGSHLCNPYEIYESVVTSVPGDPLDGTQDVGPLMVYLQAWIPPFAAGGAEPTGGMAENCGAGTYQTSDRKWRNTSFTFAIPAGGTIRVPTFNAQLGCFTTIQLACCK